KMVETLPMISIMPIMLTRFTHGVAPAATDVQNIFQGYMEGTTSAAGGQLGTGSGFDSRNTGNNYTIDGAQNNGFGRRIASSPNSDQIEEVRVETSNFDASQGHGTGLTISMMTRGGTNTLRGSTHYTHWKDRFMSADGTYKNPEFAMYRAMVPAPNQNFVAPNQQPTNNFFRAAEPDQPHNIQTSVRVDYNKSNNSRFFVRGNGNKFLESSL